jgi:hypothetical protein
VLKDCLPGYQRHKTASEVGTVHLVREHTSRPMPRIYVYDVSSKNEIGHEWILMEKANGVPWQKACSHISVFQHQEVAKIVAEWMH